MPRVEVASPEHGQVIKKAFNAMFKHQVLLKKNPTI